MGVDAPRECWIDVPQVLLESGRPEPVPDDDEGLGTTGKAIPVYTAWNLVVGATGIEPVTSAV